MGGAALEGRISYPPSIVSYPLILDPSLSAQGKGGGFIALVTGFVGICAWTLWGAVREAQDNAKRSKDVRTRLASKPILFSQHASCRMDCR
jgi:hypothetical protein